MKDIVLVHLTYGHSVNKRVKDKIKAYLSVPNVAKGKGRRGKKGDKTMYKDIICSFDIETTQYQPLKQGFMYIWQLCLGGLTIVGHTWTQYQSILKYIESELLKPNEKIVIFVHNLSYEFQWLSGVFWFDSSDIFATDRRKVLRACAGHIEYRCSYILTNMSLAEFTYKMGVENKKLSGDDFDYKAVRFPWTELTDSQLQYCINDVVGLCQALEKYMSIESDNLWTLPMTSTGFVRRDTKKRVRLIPHIKMVNLQPDFTCYLALQEAFRGGDTHANRYWVDSIIYNVKSADRSSSYPDELCNREFPMTPFKYVGFQTLELILQKIDHHYALLMRVSIRGHLRLKDPEWGFPYIPLSKCRGVKASQCVMDNGRILECESAPIEITITDIDLRIILQQYDFDEIVFTAVWMSRYGKLPHEISSLVSRYYKNKTSLKDVEGQEDFYMKEKAKLNSIYGLMVQSCTKQMIKFYSGHKDDDGNSDEWILDQSISPAELLEKYSRRGFLPYQWGVWTTAWARYDLQEGLRLVDPKNAIYVDTDSIKYIGDVDFSNYNRERIERSQKNSAFATDPHDVTHYMGVFEEEGTAYKFITQGAKKYAKESKDGHVELTCAGVSKKKGGAELQRAGGIDQFRDGFIFTESAGLNTIYNDDVNMWLKIDGHRLHITKNIYMYDDVYTLGKTDEYDKLVKNCHKLLTEWIKRNKSVSEHSSIKN